MNKTSPGEDVASATAMQFSFFGDLSNIDDDGALGGALEDGLDAPPEEERLGDAGGDIGRSEHGDLSYATMFGSILGGTGRGSRAPAGDVPLQAGMGGSSANGASGMVDPLAELMAEELERERMEEAQREKEEAERRKASIVGGAFSSGSIGLGGLLVPTSEEAVGVGGMGGMGGMGSRGVLDMPFPSPPPASMTPTGSRGVSGHHGGMLPQEMLPQGMGGVMTPDMIMRQQGGVGMPPMGMQGPGRPIMQVGGGMHPQQVQMPGMMQMPQQHMPPQYASPQQMPPQYASPQQTPPQQTGVMRGPPMNVMQRPSMPQEPLAQHQMLPGATLAQRLRTLDLADKVQPQQTQQLQFTKKFTGRCMFKDEIDTILWYQSKALRQNSPYIEDYYYQAFLDKHYNKLNKDTFAPETVRALSILNPTEKVAEGAVSFVKLEGLGRVAFSNIRRPRPLMELSATETVTVASGDNAVSAADPKGSKGSHRRLDQEPALAARVMIEDCMAAILDVQDIDRVFVASGGKNIENEETLKQRRTWLAEGLRASVGLSENPELSKGESDRVFLRLLERNKGRVLAARCLQIVQPPKEMKGVTPNYGVMWALLRHLGAIFKHSEGMDDETVKVLSRLAQALMAAIDSVSSPTALSDAMLALKVGKKGVAFFAPGENASDKDRKPWMCDVIGALLARGAALSLHETVSDDKHSNGWSEGVSRLYDDLQAFLVDGVDIKSVPVPLIGQHVIKHLSEARKDAIQKRMLELGV